MGGKARAKQLSKADRVRIARHAARCRYPLSVKERFDTKWIPEPNSGCWLWMSFLDRQGYGHFSMNGKSQKASRVSWELHRSKPPRNLHVCHHCDTPACVNPDHLFLGTQRDNKQDGFKKGRYQGGGLRGEDHPDHKLTRQQVAEIRSSNLSQYKLAKIYGVDQSNISRIKSGKAWPSPRSHARKTPVYTK